MAQNRVTRLKVQIQTGSLEPEHAASALPTQVPSIGNLLYTECWCCRSSFLGYWAQPWTGHHSDEGYQQAGTHFADLRGMTGCQPHLVSIQQVSRI